MESDTSLWKMLLTWVMLGGMLGGAIAASLWAGDGDAVERRPAPATVKGPKS